MARDSITYWGLAATLILCLLLATSTVVAAPGTGSNIDTWPPDYVGITGTETTLPAPDLGRSARIGPGVPRLPPARDEYVAGGWTRLLDSSATVFLPTAENAPAAAETTRDGVSWHPVQAHRDESGRLHVRAVSIPTVIETLLAWRSYPVEGAGGCTVARGNTLRSLLGVVRRQSMHRPDITLIHLDAPPEPEPPAPPRVGIYAGEGSWGENIRAIAQFFDHYDIPHDRFSEDEMHTLAERFDAIWFPGGFSAEYRAAIDDEASLRDFVAGGGVFFGSCAGAYYAAATTVWDGSEREQSLALFPGKAVGPVAALGPWGSTTPVRSEGPASNFERDDDTLDMYYMDGPYLVPDEEITILARYEETGEIAVAAAGHGDGRVVLIGPHPEMGYDHQQNVFDLEGGSGAQWPWLHAVVSWAINR